MTVSVIWWVALRWLAIAEKETTRANVVAEDIGLLDGNAAVAGQRPASILYGLTPSDGGSPFSAEVGVKAVFAAVSSGEPIAPYFITSPTGALYLGTLRVNGTRLFPDVGILGGSIVGVPLLTTAGAGAKLVLVDADSLLVADSGIDISRSDEASVEMLDSALQQNGLTGAGTQLASAWQSNLLLVKCERRIDWALGRADGAGYVTLPI